MNSKTATSPYLGICYNPKYEVRLNGNLLPFHKNGLQGHRLEDCNWHTHSPGKIINGK